MPTLTLGVLDVPYVNGGKSTGDVAKILEAKYHVIELFYEDHQADITEAMVNSMGDALQDLLNGAPPGNNAMTAAMSDIKVLFNRFIDTKELDGVEPGVPTAASLGGKSSRHLKGKKKGPRPSFYDTGAYEAAFMADFEP